MDYMTVREAAGKWRLGIRIVTLYCSEGRIKGATKKGNMWLIPANTEKPEDRRRKGHGMANKASLCYVTPEVFSQIVKLLPYPMHICASDGTMLFANDAFYEFAKVSNPDGDLEKHNVLNDPNLERWGIKGFVQQAYLGEVVNAYDIKVPIEEVVDKFGGEKELLPESLFHNMTAFPIYGENNELEYIVTIFITSRYYKGKEEIMHGKEYIDDHWKEDFNIDQLAEVVHMSRYHYTRLFKQHTGMTPYKYYQEVKFNKLKEMLCNHNLPISQVFSECGLDYNSNQAKWVKEKLGMTPSQYRAMMTNK